jgi:hypothetical protein
MENNKIFNLLDKAIEILDRCWKGYRPVAGVKPYEAGSCEKEMATQSDMSEIEEVIAMLDKAIAFYDPSQERDSSGKWAGGGGGSSSEQVERSTDGMDSESAKQQKYADKKAKEIASDVPSFKAYKIEGSNIDEPVLRGISKSDSGKIASALKSKGWKSAGKNEGRETFKKSENEITVSKISGKDGTDVDVLPKIDISKAK